MIQNRAARRLLAERPEFDEIGHGREPDPLLITLDTADDEWQEELSFPDALDYVEYPEKLWEFCEQTSTNVSVMEDRLRWAVDQWRSQYSEAELTQFALAQQRLASQRANVAEALLRGGERHLELDVLTCVELESRGWLGPDGLTPLPPGAGADGLIAAFG